MPATQDKLHLVYASDANYVRYIEIATCSAYVKASRPEDLIVHVLDCGIPDDVWVAFVKRIKSALSISPNLVRHVIDIAKFSGLKTWTNGSLALYARLNLPSLLPNLDWCVYADGDTLFVADPFELQEYQDPEVALKGFVCPYANENFERSWFKQNDIRLDANAYLCSGFLLMNLKWFRKHDIEAACFRFMQKCPNPPYPDQDVLNVVCSGHTAGLPKGWGTYSLYNSFSVKMKELKCIHYAMGDLPTKTHFIWQVGYKDIACLWLNCARFVLGISIKELTGIPAWRWVLGHVYTRLMNLLVIGFEQIPLARRRFGHWLMYFAPQSMLSSRFWRH